MSESCYIEIFESIKSNLMPRANYEEAQIEIERLKSELATAEEKTAKVIENLTLRRSKYEEQKLRFDILQAEKESLEAEKETLESEKKTFELKFNEISFKLKLKTNQYDSLLSSQKTDCKSNDTERISARSQTIKEEPTEIGIVNVPASSMSSPGIGSKRPNSVSADEQRKIAKRKKTANTSRNTRESAQNRPKFTCEECIDDWGLKIERDFGGDPNEKGGPDAKQFISTFNTFADYKNHVIDAHDSAGVTFCKERSCLHEDDHDKFSKASHGDIICKICDLSFKFQQHHDHHMEIAHADPNMTKKQFFDLYLKYSYDFYNDKKQTRITE